MATLEKLNKDKVFIGAKQLTKREGHISGVYNFALPPVLNRVATISKVNILNG